MKRLLTYIFALALLAACERDDFGDCGDCTGSTVYPNTEISEIIRLYAGEYRIVNEDVIVAGYVTANDVSGNFYRTFVVDDGTGALEVRAGLYDLKNLFPEGRYVAIKAKDLTVSRYNGVMQIGYSPRGGSLPEYFGHIQILDRYVIRGGEVKPVAPFTVSVPEFTDDICGRLVTVRGLRLKAGEEGTWATQSDYGSYSNRVFVDASANEITVITSKYADFAGNAIPSGTLSLTGILMKVNNSMYGLKMRRIDDIYEE
jgi:hypothetical protein